MKKPLIINIRGSHGSGKSYIVHQVLKAVGDGLPQFADRRIPYGYLCRQGTLWVPGSYESACGGCDSIKTTQEAYDSVNFNAEHGRDVLFEGVMAQSTHLPMMELHEKYDLRLVALTTSFEECIAATQKRRDEKGVTKPLSTHNIEKKYKQIQSSGRRFKQEGRVKYLEMDRKTALEYVFAELSLPAPV